MTRKTIKIKPQRGEGLAATTARDAERAVAPAASGHLFFVLCLRKKKGGGGGRCSAQISLLFFFIFFPAVTFRARSDLPSRAPPTSGVIHKVTFIYYRLLRVHNVMRVAVLI